MISTTKLDYSVVWKDKYINEYQILYFDNQAEASEFARKVYTIHLNYFLFKGNNCIKMLDAILLDKVNNWKNKEVKK